MSDNHDGVLLEDINGKLDTLVEVVTTINERLTRVEGTTDRILESVDDLYPLNAEAIDHADKIANHEHRLLELKMPSGHTIS